MAHFWNQGLDKRIRCPVGRCDLTCETLEDLLQHADHASQRSTKQKHHLFLVNIMENRVCILVGCGTAVKTLFELLQHMRFVHDWAWSRRLDPKFEYKFDSGVSAPHHPDWHISGTASSIQGASDSDPASTLPLSQTIQPKGPPPLLQSHMVEDTFVGAYRSSADLQHESAVIAHHQEETERHLERNDNAQKSNKSEVHESDNESPSEEDPENFHPFSDDPTRTEEIKFVNKLLSPTLMHYKHLTGDADAIMSDDVPTDRYFIKWQKLQNSLNRWWKMRGETSQVPELIIIYEWSVEEVMWTYEYDAKIFGPLLDLKGRKQKFKKLSPVMSTSVMAEDTE